MATLFKSLGLSREEYPDQQEWIERLLRPLNAFSVSVVNALGTLTRGQNLVGQVEVVEFETGGTVADSFPMYFGIKMRARPVACWVGRIENVTTPTATFSSAVMPTWELTADNRVKLANLSGITTSTKYRVTFLLE